MLAEFLSLACVLNEVCWAVVETLHLGVEHHKLLFIAALPINYHTLG